VPDGGRLKTNAAGFVCLSGAPKILLTSRDVGAFKKEVEGTPSAGFMSQLDDPDKAAKPVAPLLNTDAEEAG